MSLFLSACVSSGEDYAVAAAVVKYLDATGVIPSANREADRTHSGKIVYFAPGINGSPHFTYYEVTDPADMQKLKTAAETALKEVPAARKVTLHFMEKQVLHLSANGAGYRGHEKEIKKIVVQRND
jgi:hypothetical protein